VRKSKSSECLEKIRSTVFIFFEILSGTSAAKFFCENTLISLHVGNKIKSTAQIKKPFSWYLLATSTSVMDTNVQSESSETSQNDD
jgi:hypothetical protein